MPQRDPAVDTATARNLIFNAAAHSTDDAADDVVAPIKLHESSIECTDDGTSSGVRATGSSLPSASMGSRLT